MLGTENAVLMQKARESLKGKWTLAIGTFLLYFIISGSLGSIKHVGFVVSLLISGPFVLGVSIFTLSLSRGEEARLEQIFEGFRHYGKSLATHLLGVLLIVLWSLLLIVPGIIAALSYSMSMYLLADDRTLEPMQALKNSKQMMNGHKWKLFYLLLRFFGLSLLCMLTLGIGFLWLVPYAAVTLAKFYDDVKNAAPALAGEGAIAYRA